MKERRRRLLQTGGVSVSNATPSCIHDFLNRYGTASPNFQ
jgi:hypothetical protein